MLIMNQARFVSETKSAIEIDAPAKSDFFVDPVSAVVRDDAPFYYQMVEGDFTARASVRPSFARRYDAGGLLVLDSTRKWIKHELELTDLGYPSIVSVVTDGTSDDSNGERMEGRETVWLQVARQGDTWALHWSEDGKRWKMTRYFRLKMRAAVRVGLEAQSPMGRGCRVEFSGLKIVGRAPRPCRSSNSRRRSSSR